MLSYSRINRSWLKRGGTADNGLLASEIASGITRVKGVASKVVRLLCARRTRKRCIRDDQGNSGGNLTQLYRASTPAGFANRTLITGNIGSYFVGPRARPAEVATPRNRGPGPWHGVGASPHTAPRPNPGVRPPTNRGVHIMRDGSSVNAGRLQVTFPVPFKIPRYS